MMAISTTAYIIAFSSIALAADAFSPQLGRRRRSPPLYAEEIIDGSYHLPSRRDILSTVATATIASSSVVFYSPQVAQAATSSPPPLPLQTTSGIARVEEIGGGLDILSPQPLSSSDVFYPSSMTNTNWKVQRVINSVEGDLGQAALAWQLLGGSSDERAFTSKLTEVYQSSYIEVSPQNMKDATYEFEGKKLQAAVLDRGSELASRTGIAKDLAQWDTTNNSLTYTRNNNNDAVNLTVVRRKIEPPSEAGFGFDEIYRIESSAGGIFGGTNLDRCAKVRRRYRRGFDESSGKRIIDAIEIVTTHRVMDGIAGIEMPTSTCKSRLRYTQL